MPSIQSQSVVVLSSTHAQLTLVTQQFGTVLVDVSQSGQNITITSFQDGVQKGQTVLNNPPAATTEAQIDAAVQALLPGGFQFRSHLISSSPIILQIGTWNLGDIISANWWQR